jgi:hypothetical protein
VPFVESPPRISRGVNGVRSVKLITRTASGGWSHGGALADQLGELLVPFGGRSLKEQRRSLRNYTEAPIRQGKLGSPWENLMGGVVLGDVEEARKILKDLKSNPAEQTSVRQAARESRPAWSDLVSVSEGFLGRTWSDLTSRHGYWGRNGLMAVATRHPGWRLIEGVREIPGLSYGAAAQGIRQFWRLLPAGPAKGPASAFTLLFHSGWVPTSPRRTSVCSRRSGLDSGGDAAPPRPSGTDRGSAPVRLVHDVMPRPCLTHAPRKPQGRRSSDGCILSLLSRM